jgi:hypothetical protein
MLYNERSKQFVVKQAVVFSVFYTVSSERLEDFKLY